MLRELREILAEVAGRDDGRMLILTGAGHAFCAKPPPAFTGR